MSGSSSSASMTECCAKLSGRLLVRMPLPWTDAAILRRQAPAHLCNPVLGAIGWAQCKRLSVQPHQMIYHVL